jgi:hypothetical protein
VYRKLKREGAFDYPLIPSDFRLDSSKVAPRQAALLIAAALGLPVRPQAS